jgi:outer membrane murein-binding lipoprotein Lpp
MKTGFRKLTLSAMFFSAVFLAGCGNKDQQEKTTFDVPPPAAAKAPAHPAPADNSVRYYAENLKTAKGVWDACQKRGAAGMSENELQNCANAQSAWEMQPRKARK